MLYVSACVLSFVHSFSYRRRKEMSPPSDLFAKQIICKIFNNQNRMPNSKRVIRNFELVLHNFLLLYAKVIIAPAQAQQQQQQQRQMLPHFTKIENYLFLRFNQSHFYSWLFLYFFFQCVTVCVCVSLNLVFYLKIVYHYSALLLLFSRL